MKKLAVSFLLIPLLLPGTASGQSDVQNKSKKLKTFTISGKVSEDGKSLIGKNGQPWLVANPDALVGHESRQVKVKCQISSGSHDIRVLSSKMVAPQTKYPVNLGDAAFRR